MATAPHDLDDCLEAQLLFTTPAAVVVNARVVDGERMHVVGLVISRRACLGDHPQRAALELQAKALLDERAAAAPSLPPAARRVEIMVGGCWQSVCPPICAEPG